MQYGLIETGQRALGAEGVQHLVEVAHRRGHGALDPLRQSSRLADDRAVAQEFRRRARREGCPGGKHEVLSVYRVARQLFAGHVEDLDRQP